jgi:hypothetical protein
MPTFIAICAVIGEALARPRIPSVPKYFLAIGAVLSRYPQSGVLSAASQ